MLVFHVSAVIHLFCECFVFSLNLLNKYQFGKKLFIRFNVRAFLKLLPIYVYSFLASYAAGWVGIGRRGKVGGEGERICDLVVYVPDQCPS